MAEEERNQDPCDSGAVQSEESPLPARGSLEKISYIFDVMDFEKPVGHWSGEVRKAVCVQEPGDRGEVQIGGIIKVLRSF